MINVHKARCDALVIQPGCREVSHVPLPRFSYDRAIKAGAQLAHLVRSSSSMNRAYIRNIRPNNAFGKTLAVLWIEIVKPVLDFLGYVVRVPTENYFSSFLT